MTQNGRLALSDPTYTSENETKEEKDSGNICIRAFSNMTIEPMLFLHILAGNLVSVLTANLYIDRICRVTLNYTQETCRAYSRGNTGDGVKDPQIETEIQIHASTLMIYENIIEFGPVILFALFLGSWSDRYGTKKPMVFSVFGSAVWCLIMLCITLFSSLRPEYIWLAFIPLGLTGGSLALNVSAYSYMSRITKEEDRSFRMILLQTCWFLGQPIGTLLGPKIFARTDFIPVFITSSVLYTLAVIYGCIFIKEEIPERNINSPDTSPFSVSGVKNMMLVAFKKREGSLRVWVIWIWILSLLRVTIHTGTINLIYLFCRQQLKWNVHAYTEFQSINWILSCAGNFGMAHLAFKVFKIKDPVVGFLCSAGYVFTSILYAFATKSWMMYLGACINMVLGLQLASIRSLLSKFVRPDEIAKAFCFIHLTDSLINIPAGTLFNIFYNYTVGGWAGAFFLVQSFLYSVMALIFGYFAITMKRRASMDKPVAVIELTSSNPPHKESIDVNK